MIRIGILLVFAVVLPLAAAQSSSLAPEAGVELSLGEFPMSVSHGDLVEVAVNVTLWLGNFACSRATDAQVSLSAHVLGENGSANFSPQILRFRIGTGLFLQHGYEGTLPAALVVQVAKQARPGPLVLNLTANFAGGQIPECEASQPFPMAASRHEIGGAIVVPPATNATLVESRGSAPSNATPPPFATLFIALTVLAAIKRSSSAESF
ncbi:MAG TPA: hypothetical protein VM241_07340 [Candidatus Thermoplasmatota archaeon]|nr:hypothetical protein [Candidatus Thermoplasmatota archaeon]